MRTSTFEHCRSFAARAAIAAVLALGFGGYASAQDVPKVMNLATHGIGTLLNSMGIGLAKVISAHVDTQVKVVPTAGPREWLPQISTGEIQMGVLNNYDALHGRHADDGYAKALQGKGAPIMLLTSGTRNWMSLLTSGKSGIKGCADLKGKRIVSRFTGSAGVTAQCAAILANCGLRPGDYRPVVVAGGPAKGVRAVIEGKADATASAAVGMGIVADLNARKGARFISLNGSRTAWKRFERHFPATLKKIEPGAHRVGVHGPTNVGEYPFYLVGAKSLSNEAAYEIVKALWVHNAELFPMHARLRAWVKEHYVDPTATIPYHPGAIKFYKEVGAWSAKMDRIQAKLLSMK